MTGTIKRNTLIFLGVVMITTIVIAASLPQLELQPGMPLPRLEKDQVVVPAAKAKPSQAVSVNEFILRYVLLLAAGSVLYVIYKLLGGIEWKDLAKSVRSMLLIGLIAGALALLIMQFKFETAPVEVPVVPTPDPLVESPLGSAPPLLLWLVGIGLLVAGILIGIWIVVSPARRVTTMAIVGFEAEKARQELRTGLGLKEVIIRCYRQMSMALKQGQGIEREDFMTTREFENLLEATGVPHEPVHQLTQLFEAVRYGNWQPNLTDEQRAIHCLEAIVVYSREVKEIS